MTSPDALSGTKKEDDEGLQGMYSPNAVIGDGARYESVVWGPRRALFSSLWLSSLLLGLGTSQIALDVVVVAVIKLSLSASLLLRRRLLRFVVLSSGSCRF